MSCSSEFQEHDALIVLIAASAGGQTLIVPMFDRGALMVEVNGVLRLLWIERPPLDAANTASIH